MLMFFIHTIYSYYLNKVEGSRFDAADDKHYFYWFFEKRTTSLQPSSSENSDEPVPLLIWLNGGPGCSSMLGLLTENGPCLVNSAGDGTTVNPYSWNEVAHILYLDQPAKTGYSYGEANDHNEDMVAEDAYYFIQAFLQSEEGQKYQDSPLYLTGESYAGHYIPAIAHRILEGNEGENDLLTIPLAGVAIGNPWLDPETQYQWYAAMASENSHGLKIFTDEEVQKMKDSTPQCISSIHECNAGNGVDTQLKCQIADIICDDLNMGPLDARDISPYDITKTVSYSRNAIACTLKLHHMLILAMFFLQCIGDDCINTPNLSIFLNLDSTKEALHVPTNISWKECSDRVHMKFESDDAVTVAPYLTELLHKNIPVLLYAGDLDYICNYLGTKAVALNLEWDHKNDFNAAADHQWGNQFGLVRSSSGLTFLQVYDSGHMVPSDKPDVALAMITHFVNGKVW